MQKKHLIGYPAAALVALVVGASSATSATPEPVVKTVTVTKAVTPQACLDALDLTQQFANLMAAEHTDLGHAFETYGAAGDFAGLAASVTATETKVSKKVNALSTRMEAVAPACRGAS